MQSPKEDIAPRVLALVRAQKILQREGVISNVVNIRIRKRIAEILATHPEIEKIIEEFHTKAELTVSANNLIPESVESKIPLELRQELSKDQLIFVETLLKLGPNGKPVNNKDLVKAIYNEEYDNHDLCPHKLRAIATKTRTKIKGWGTIHREKGVGYWLEVEAK